MTPEGILTEDELPFDSAQGQRVVRALRDQDTFKFYRARERQVRVAAKQAERRTFGDGATVTMRLDPVLVARIAQDPRFGKDCFGESEFEKDMRKYHPEFMVNTHHQRRVFALGGLVAGKPANKEDKYLVTT